MAPLANLTCGTCIHKAPDKFKGPKDIATQTKHFFGCELRDKSVGMQDKTPACGWYVAVTTPQA